MRCMAVLTCLVVCASPVVAQTQGNPVLDAARALGSTGLSGKTKPDKSPTAFTPAQRGRFVDQFLAPMSDDPAERKQLRDVILALADGLEEEMKPRGRANDASAALGLTLVALTAAIEGKEADDAALYGLIDRLQASLNSPAVVGATASQKQELYELSLSTLGFGLALLQAGTTPLDRARSRIAVDNLLAKLIGLPSANLKLVGKELVLTPVKNDAASTDLAPGFTFTPPPGWTQLQGWHVAAVRDGRDVHGANVRLLPAIPAKGNIGEALIATWKTGVAGGAQHAPGGMVYRRFVGDSLLAQFVVGTIPQAGTGYDSLVALFMIDAKTHWQPIVVALTWTSDLPVGGSTSARFSWGTSVKLVETFLESLRCPAGKTSILVDPKALAGHYGFGSGATQDLVNIYTGASAFSYLSTGGELNLKADMTFEYRYSSAQGVAGITSFRGAKGTGTWRVEREFLITTFKTYDQGDGYFVKERRYRIGGLTQFPGEKVAVLLFDRDAPIDMLNRGDSSDWYTTKRKQ